LKYCGLKAPHIAILCEELRYFKQSGSVRVVDTRQPHRGMQKYFWHNQILSQILKREKNRAAPNGATRYAKKLMI